MKIRANCQLYGDYGMLRPNQEKIVPDHIGRELVANGLAKNIGGEKMSQPSHGYSIVPAQNKAVTPSQSPAPKIETRNPYPSSRSENKRKR